LLRVREKKVVLPVHREQREIRLKSKAKVKEKASGAGNVA